MDFIGKKYTLTRSENFDEYMKELGVGYFLRIAGNNTYPTCYLTKNGDDYEFHTVSTFRTSVLKFKLGVEAPQETLDGRKVPTTFTLEGNTLTQVERGDVKSTIIREFTADELKTICTYGKVVSTRYYKAD